MGQDTSRCAVSSLLRCQQYSFIGHLISNIPVAGTQTFFRRFPSYPARQRLASSRSYPKTWVPSDFEKADWPATARSKTLAGCTARPKWPKRRFSAAPSIAVPGLSLPCLHSFSPPLRNWRRNGAVSGFHDRNVLSAAHCFAVPVLLCSLNRLMAAHERSTFPTSSSSLAPAISTPPPPQDTRKSSFIFYVPSRLPSLVSSQIDAAAPVASALMPIGIQALFFGRRFPEIVPSPTSPESHLSLRLPAET